MQNLLEGLINSKLEHIKGTVKEAGFVFYLLVHYDLF